MRSGSLTFRGRVMLAAIAALAGIPGGYALAQSEEGSSQEESPLSAAEAFEQGFTPEPAPKGPDAIPDGMNLIGKSLPGQIVQRCERDPRAEPDCGLILAISEGKIEPGWYTNPELEDAVSDAGYQLSFEELGGQ